MNVTPRGRRIGRFSVALAAVLLSTIGLAGGVSAAPSRHLEEHYVTVIGSLETAGAMASIAAYDSNLIGDDAGFELWIEPDLPWTGPPTYTSGRADFTVGAGDSSLTGTFDILDRDGILAGRGVLDATLAPNGELVEVTWPKSSGNVKHREYQVYQPMLASGSVTVTIGSAEYAFGLDGVADGFAADFTAFDNDPASTIDWQTFAGLGFTAVSGDTSIQLAMRDEAGLALTEVVVQHGDQLFNAIDDGTDTSYQGGRYEVGLDLLPTGEGLSIGASSATSGTITGSATVRPAKRFAWSEDVGDGATLRIAVQTYTVSGSFTVSFDDGTTETFVMDDANGYAERVSLRLTVPPSS